MNDITIRISRDDWKPMTIRIPMGVVDETPDSVAKELGLLITDALTDLWDMQGAPWPEAGDPPYSERGRILRGSANTA